jgi:hypothetical protein
MSRSLNALCQRCRREQAEWLIRQAEFNVGTVQNWKVMLCQLCTAQVELVLTDALRETEHSVGGVPCVTRT